MFNIIKGCLKFLCTLRADMAVAASDVMSARSPHQSSSKSIWRRRRRHCMFTTDLPSLRSRMFIPKQEDPAASMAAVASKCKHVKDLLHQANPQRKYAWCSQTCSKIIKILSLIVVNSSLKIVHHIA